MTQNPGFRSTAGDPARHCRTKVSDEALSTQQPCQAAPPQQHVTGAPSSLAELSAPRPWNASGRHLQAKLASPRDEPRTSNLEPRTWTESLGRLPTANPHHEPGNSPHNPRWPAYRITVRPPQSPPSIGTRLASTIKTQPANHSARKNRDGPGPGPGPAREYVDTLHPFLLLLVVVFSAAIRSHGVVVCDSLLGARLTSPRETQT